MYALVLSTKNIDLINNEVQIIKFVNNQNINR